MTVKKVPKASLLGLDLLSNPVEFTKKAVERHGHVWEVTVGGFFGPRVFGLAGAEGLKAFYDQKNINRFQGCNFALLSYGWTCKGYSGLPPIDGPGFFRRKRNFLTLTTRESAEKFLQVTDDALVKMYRTMGNSGEPFSYWDLLNRFVFENYSKEWFGMGILDYEGGRFAADIIQGIQDTFALVGSKDKNYEPHEKAKAILVAYFEAAIAAVRKAPKQYAFCRLAAFLETEDTKKLTDDEIIMDLYQVLVFGTYGLATQGVTLADALINNPDVRAKVAREVENVPEPLSLTSLLGLEWTVAFVKECLRFYPVVHSVVGYSLRDFEVEGMIIPAHEKVMACLWGTLHDPAVFKDPEEFDPRRHLKPLSDKQEENWSDFNVVFGAGPGTTGHSCGGKQVAFAGLVHQAVRIVQNWDFHKEDPDEQIVWPRCEPHPENGFMLRRGPEPERRRSGLPIPRLSRLL